MSQRRAEASAWGDLVIGWLERVWRIIRGLPHNRLATTTVAIGGALLISPFWEPILRATLAEFLGIRADPPLDGRWGIVLIAIALAYHALSAQIASRETIDGRRRVQALEDRIRAHDAPIFQDFLVTAPEIPFESAMSSIINDHSYTSEQNRTFLGASYFLQALDHQFNHAEVRTHAEALITAITTLDQFVVNHFHPFGPPINGGFRFCMEPQWNIDRGGNPTRGNDLAYAELTSQLEPLVSTTSAAYRAFVINGHRRLL